MPSNKRPAEEAEDTGGYGSVGNGYEEDRELHADRTSLRQVQGET